MPVSDEEARRFVRTYSGDASKVRFSPSQAPDEEGPIDENEAFRSAVIDQVLERPALAPLALLIELYRALTEHSAEAWGIDSRVEHIGKLMLLSGRKGVARDYLVGAAQSFDALCATSFTDCPRDVAEECLEHARTSLAAAGDAEEEALWSLGLERFGLLVEHSV